MERPGNLDENSLEFAKFHKKHLRFDIGDVVWLKSDLKKRCPMCITHIEIFERYYDYNCEWLTSQNTKGYGSFLDKTLYQ
jgi:hypothetical protein